MIRMLLLSWERFTTVCTALIFDHLLSHPAAKPLPYLAAQQPGAVVSA